MATEVKSEVDCSERQACRWFGVHRSTYRYESKIVSLYEHKRATEVVKLSQEHPEFGADKIAHMVRKSGYRVSNQLVREIRRTECLKLPEKPPKRVRKGNTTGKPPVKAEYRGHVWTWDFIHDRTIKGGSYRTLSIVDEYTRENIALFSDRSIGATKVKQVFAQCCQRYGAPEHIRSDNGPEFIAKIIQSWLKSIEVKTLYIDPGSPWQNGFVESFHDKFRRECLNRNLFYTLTEARVVIADWRKKYNEVRPHRSLGMKTPQEYAQSLLPSKITNLGEVAV